MNVFRILSACACALLLGACARQIVITPDLAKLEGGGVASLKKTVGLYVPPEDKARQVTTAGGGGDKVSYFPYRDLETGVYRMLINVFEKVVVMKSPTDSDAFRRDGVTLVVTPTIATDSSSDSLLRWPPTSFSVRLTCAVSDAAGKVVTQPTVEGVGKATLSEIIADVSVAGKRASQDALGKMQRALLDAPELRR